MKVVHIINGLGVGGAELMLKRLVQGLDKKNGMQHVVISLTDLGPIGQQLREVNVDVIALSKSNVLSPIKVFFRLRHAIKEHAPDIVQTWMYRADLLGGLAARSAGVDKVIWNVRCTYLNDSGILKFIFRKICAYLSCWIPRKIIFVSYSAQREHLKAGYSKKKALVIENGFDTDKFVFNRDSRAHYRSEMKLKSDDVAVFSVGRYVPAKDHRTFVRAVCGAVKSNKNIKGVLVGRNIDIEKFSLSDAEKKYFILLGEQADIAGLLSAADVFCLHSITEGFPNVLGEAMSLGLPCIATKAGDAALILANRRYTVDVGDVASIASLIVELSQRIERSPENRERIVMYFSLESVLNKYSMLYREIDRG